MINGGRTRLAPVTGKITTTAGVLTSRFREWVTSSGRLQGRPRCGSEACSRRTEATNFPKQRELSPVKGSIQDGTDAVITPATT